MKQSQKQGVGNQTAESRERSFNEGSFDNNVTLSQDPKDPTNDDEAITTTNIMGWNNQQDDRPTNMDEPSRHLFVKGKESCGSLLGGLRSPPTTSYIAS